MKDQRLVPLLGVALWAFLPLSPSGTPTLAHTFFVSAQDRDQLLSSLIEGLQRKYSRARSLSADFVQSYTGGDGRTITERGHLMLKRPGKARWDYAEPEKKLFVSDGHSIYFYVLGDRQAARSTVRESRDPQIPFLFLLGRGNLRSAFSSIEIASDLPLQGGDVVLRLAPRKAPEEFKTLLVEANPATFAVNRMVIFERNGTRMSFLLSNVQENQAFSMAEHGQSSTDHMMVAQSNTGKRVNVID